MRNNALLKYALQNVKAAIVWAIWLSALPALYAQQPGEASTDEYDRELSSISIYGENHMFFQNGDYAYNFGARLDLQAGIFGFYYKIGLGGNPNGKVYMHVPLGVEVGLVIAAYGITGGGNSYYLLIPAVLCAVVPEGVTLRFWQRNNVNLKFYCSPWGSELNISPENFTLVSGEFGLQGNLINHHRYNVSCYAGTKVLYKHLQPAATIGATVGILLD